MRPGFCKLRPQLVSRILQTNDVSVTKSILGVMIAQVVKWVVYQLKVGGSIFGSTCPCIEASKDSETQVASITVFEC